MLTIATGANLDWARAQVATHHYLYKPPDPRSRPFAYVVVLSGERVGCLFFGRPESTCCFKGALTYGGAADVASGRAAYDRWEILNLSRVWLSPDVQRGGRLCTPEMVPGFVDRRGVWQPALASAVIGAALSRVGCDYLLAQPPCFLEEPYRIRVVMSYCDTRLHQGTIYRASGFQLARRNRAGIETWFTTAVADLTVRQDARVRAASALNGRSRRLRFERSQRLLFSEES